MNPFEDPDALDAPPASAPPPKPSRAVPSTPRNGADSSAQSADRLLTPHNAVYADEEPSASAACTTPTAARVSELRGGTRRGLDQSMEVPDSPTSPYVPHFSSKRSSSGVVPGDGGGHSRTGSTASSDSVLLSPPRVLHSSMADSDASSDAGSLSESASQPPSVPDSPALPPNEPDGQAAVTAAQAGARLSTGVSGPLKSPRKLLPPQKALPPKPSELSATGPPNPTIDVTPSPNAPAVAAPVASAPAIVLERSPTMPRSMSRVAPPVDGRLSPPMDGARRRTTSFSQPVMSRAEAKAKRLKEEREATAAAKAKFVSYFFVIGCSRGIKPVPGKTVNADDPFATPFEGALLDCFPAPTKHEPFPDHIWMFCLPRGLFFRPSDGGVSCFPFVLTNTTGWKLSGYCLTYYELVPPDLLKSIGLPTRTPVYAPKCLCLLSHWPYWSTYRQWLSELYDLSVRRGQAAPVEQLVFNMFMEVPLPPPGKAIEFAVGDKVLRASNPAKNDLPLCDVPINMVFKCLGINTVIRIFQHLLLEGRVLFYSQHYSLLSYACEAFRSFLFPFQWHHVYVPVLSEALAEFPAYTPTPFIMGVGASYLESVLDLIKQQDQMQELVLVDLDNGAVMGPSLNVEFPEPETGQLMKDLRTVLYSDVLSVDLPSFDPYSNPRRNPAELDRRIRLAFFRHFVSLFKYYRQFMVYIRVVPAPVAVFNTESFCTLHPEYMDFLEAFMETQAFMVFLEEHNWPRPNLFDAWIDSEAYKLSFDELVARYCSSEPLQRPDVVAVKFTASIPPPDSAPIDGFPRLRLKLLEAAQASFVRPSLEARSLRSSSEGRYVEQSLHQATEGIHSLDALERSRNRDEKDKVAALVAKLLSRTHAADRPLDEVEHNQLVDFLQVDFGWKEFAEQLAKKRPENKKADRQLSHPAYVQMLDLIHCALRHCHQHDDLVTPRVLLVPLFTYFFEVQSGASEYLYEGVRTHPVWQTSNFWEKAMYEGLTSEYRKRYGDIRVYMEKWPQLSQAEHDAAVAAETDAIFTQLTEFAFKMVNMHTKVDLIRKFMTRMCSLTSLDDERSIQLSQLLSNMIMAQELMDKTEKNDADMGLAYSDTPGFMLVDASKTPQTGSYLQTFVEEKGRGGMLRKMRNQFASEFSSSTPRKKSVRHSDSSEYRDDYMVKTFRGHSEGIVCVSVDATRIISGSCDGTIKLWSPLTTACVQTFAGHENWVSGVAVDNENKLVSGSYDCNLKLWDLVKCCKLFTLRGHKGSISCFQLRDRNILSGSSDGTLNLWDNRYKKPVLTFTGHSGPIVCMDWDGNRLATGSRDTTLRVWDVRNGRTTRVLTGHKDWVKTCKFVGSDTVVSGSCDSTVRTWNLQSEDMKILMGHTGAVNGIMWDAGSGCLVSTSADASIRFWDLKTGKLLKSSKVHNDEIVACAPFQTKLVTGSYDCTLKIWDQDRVLHSLVGHKLKVSCVSVHENRIVSGSWDKTLKLWEFPLNVRL